MLLNLGLLPVYESVEEQFRTRANEQNKEIFTLELPRIFLPGFCFKRKARKEELTAFEILNLDGTLAYTLPKEQIKLYVTGTYDYVKFTTGHAFNTGNLDTDTFLDNSIYLQVKPEFSLACGLYYYRISFGDKYYYSDVFRLKDATEVIDGVNVVNNGDFHNAGVGWTTAGTWIFDAINGYAQCNSNAGGLVLSQSISGCDSGNRKYKVSFTVLQIGTSGAGTGIEVRAYSSSTDYPLNQALRVNQTGAFYFYANRVDRFAVYATGTGTMRISDIKIEEVLGFEEGVLIQAFNECRDVNAIGSDGGYSDIALLDTECAQPEYGEDLAAAENGNGETVYTFARAFKKYAIDTEKAPEFIADFLAKLNAFDEVVIYDGKQRLKFEYSESVDDTDAYEVADFKVKNEFLPGDVYAQTSIKFDATLALRASCCDDITVLPCSAISEITTEIQVLSEPRSGVLLIGVSGDPLPTGAYVELFEGHAPVADFTNCAAISNYSSTGIIVSASDFNNVGIQYEVADRTGSIYCFYIRVYQLGCTAEYVSSKMSFDPR